MRMSSAPMTSPMKEPTIGTSEVTPMTTEMTSGYGKRKMRMQI